jgi:hypothetical protein
MSELIVTQLEAFKRQPACSLYVLQHKAEELRSAFVHELIVRQIKRCEGKNPREHLRKMTNITFFQAVPNQSDTKEIHVLVVILSLLLLLHSAIDSSNSRGIMGAEAAA